MQSPPVRNIPENMYNEYTMNRTINVFDWYIDNSISDTLEWTEDMINIYIQRYSIHNILNNLEINRPYPEGEPYNRGSLFNLKALQKYSEYFIGKKVAVIGSLLPWLEAILYNIGVRDITTVEYNKPSETSKIKTILYTDFATSNDKYDAFLSYSSIEHSGLGRYGDPLNPNGDIETIKLIHSKLNTNGILLLGIPVGQDAITWNAHRVYGKKRLPLLTNGFKELEWIGLDKSYLDGCPPENNGPQPVIVLQKL